jgi:hypothetical protein
MRYLPIALVLLVASTAHAQPPGPSPVTVNAEGVFGQEALIGDGYDAIAVTVRNDTSAAMRGRVVISVRQWQQAEQLVEVPLDVPAHESRRVIATPFVADSSTIEVRYVIGSGLSSPFATTLVPNYGQSARALVVLADPPRLRGALLDMQTNVRSPAYGYGGGGTTASGVPLGLVAFDARTGDPILPETALGWASVGVLTVSAPALTRASQAQLEALSGWLHGGGRIVIFPRSDADLAIPFVHEHFAGVHRGQSQMRIDGQAAIETYECGDAHRETFGCSMRAGFGAVYLADFDGSAPPYVELPGARAIVQAVVDAANGGYDSVAPVLTFGRHTDDTTDSGAYYGSGQQLSFGRMRAALDPNEGYRPALALVGVVLFLYVLLVGPLNFWWVGRRQNPTLALVTTPIAALACAAVMFGVGYVGKGVVMRYRRVEIVEAVEGDAIGVARRYTGYYFTRPTSMDTSGPEGGGVTRLLGGAGGIVRAGDTRPTLRGATGGLWETVFTREEHQVDLGGGISFTLDGRRLASVHNATSAPLHHAFVVDASGNVYVIGEVAAGASADIPRDGSAYLPTSGFYDQTSPEVATLRDALGLGGDEASYAFGIARLLGSLPSGLVPVLYATTDPDAAPTSSPSFARERDLRIVRLVPNIAVPEVFVPPTSFAAVTTVAPPPPDPMGAALQNLFGRASIR